MFRFSTASPLCLFCNTQLLSIQRSVSVSISFLSLCALWPCDQFQLSVYGLLFRKLIVCPRRYRSTLCEDHCALKDCLLFSYFLMAVPYPVPVSTLGEQFESYRSSFTELLDQHKVLSNLIALPPIQLSYVDQHLSILSTNIVRPPSLHHLSFL